MEDNRLHTRHSTATSKAWEAEEDKGKRGLTTWKKIWRRKMETLKQRWIWYETDGSGGISCSLIISSADGWNNEEESESHVLTRTFTLHSTNDYRRPQRRTNRVRWQVVLVSRNATRWSCGGFRLTIYGGMIAAAAGTDAGATVLLLQTLARSYVGKCFDVGRTRLSPEPFLSDAVWSTPQCWRMIRQKSCATTYIELRRTLFL